MDKPNGADLERRAAASLRKRGNVWWTHFGCNGQFFRRSLGTSDRSEATSEARKLIALAEAGKLPARASSPRERKDWKSSSLTKSYSDPKVLAKATRRNRRTWAKATDDHRKRHRDGLIAAANRPGKRQQLSETTEKLWSAPGTASEPSYRERNSAAVRDAWKPRKKREQHGEKISAARKRPEVKANHLAGRIQAAEDLLRRVAEQSAETGPGRPSMEERNTNAASLHEKGWSWNAIARKLDSDYAKNPKAARERVRQGAMSAMRSKKQEASDEPKTLHDGRSLEGGGREAPDAAVLD
jgi:hypothetical protein